MTAAQRVPPPGDAAGQPEDDNTRVNATLNSLVTGVTVVATGRHKMTVSAALPVSDDPPIVAVSLMRPSRGLDALPVTGTFTINVLADRHREVAVHFGRRGRRHAEEDDSAVGNWMRGEHGPRLRDAVAYLGCSLLSVTVVGDHAVVLGLVEEGVTADGSPLVRFRRRLRELP